MLNKELIEKLQKLPLDAKVIVMDGPDGRPNEVESVGKVPTYLRDQLGFGKFIIIRGGNY